jgi:hypothetical protein
MIGGYERSLFIGCALLYGHARRHGRWSWLFSLFGENNPPAILNVRFVLMSSKASPPGGFFVSRAKQRRWFYVSVNGFGSSGFQGVDGK